MRGLVYIHVPKCGGSSISAALRLWHPLSQASISLGHHLVTDAQRHADTLARVNQLRDLMARRTRLIVGHVPFTTDNRDAGYRFVTVLRDPVERFVSHYNYLQHAHPDPRRAPKLDGFLETGDAARLASQYLHYFGNTDIKRQKPSVRIAVANLMRFDLVGDSADLRGFARQLRHLTGHPLPIFHRNRAPVPTRVPQHLRSRIEQLCEQDLSIFDAVNSYRSAA